MKLAVLSDVHGNAIALDAVLADLARDPADQLVCLGDMVQGGAQPAEVVARLRALACPVVMGNADAYVLSGTGIGAGAPAAEAAKLADVRAWTFERLSEDDRRFVAAFPPTVAMDVGGRSFLGYHGTPDSFDEILMPDMPREVFERHLAPHAADFMAGGHVHLQFSRTFGRSVHFNPGSIGESYDRTAPPEQWNVRPWAEYAVLEAEGGRTSLSFRRVPYDVGAYVAAIRASGRPHADDVIRRFDDAV